MSLSHAEVLDMIAACGRCCEQHCVDAWEAEEFGGSLLAMADYREAAEACAVIAFNLARGRL